MSYTPNGYQHDWQVGDWAYSLKDSTSFSEGDVSKVTRVCDDGSLLFGFHYSSGRDRGSETFAPVLTGEEIMRIGGWRDLRLIRVFPIYSAHGTELNPVNTPGITLNRNYAIAGWQSKPKPDTSHIEERIEKARQELEAAQRELWELQG